MNVGAFPDINLEFYNKMFDSFVHPLAIIDIDSYDVIKINKKLDTGLNSDKCFSQFYGLDKPCDKYGRPCPISKVKSIKDSFSCVHIYHENNYEKKITEVHAHPILCDGNEVKYMLEYHIDVTEINKIEKINKINESIYETLFQNSSTAIFIHDIDNGLIIDANKRALKIYDYQYVDDFRRNEFWLSSPYSFVEAKELMKMAIAFGEQQFEWKAMRSDGKIIWLKVNIKAVILEGVRRILVEADEITEKKEVEEDLIASEKKYKMITEMMSDGLCVFSSDKKLKYASPSYFKITGYSEQEEMSKSYEEMLDCIYDEDKNSLIIKINSAIERKEKELLYEYRFRKKSGDIIWREDHATFIYNGEGSLENVYVVCRDISERKDLENKYSENEKKFRLIFENSIVGFALHEMIYDENGNPKDYRFLELNKAFCEMVGTKVENWIGKTVKEVLPETEQYWIETYGNVTKTRGTIRFENFSKEFDKYFEVWAFSPEENKFAVVFVDITERKKAENKLIKETEFRKLMVDISSNYINVPFDKIEDVTNRSLKLIGEFVKADRVYIFDYNLDEYTCSNTYEWCNCEVLSMIDSLQNVPLSLMPESWVNSHRNCEAIYYGDIDGLGNSNEERLIKNMFQPQGIKSILTIPLCNDSNLLGFVGFDSVKEKHHYSFEEGIILNTFAKMLVNVKLRKDMERALLEQKSYNEKILDAIPDVIFIFNKKGVITELRNGSNEQYFLSREQLLGKHHSLFLPKSVSEEISFGIKNVLETQQIQVIDFKLQIKNSERYFTARMAKKSEHSVIAMVRDTTSEKQAIEHQKYESIGILSSGIAHEINNPINGIMNYAQLIFDRTKEQNSIKEFSNEIINESIRVSKIVKNLLQFARKENNAFEENSITDIVDSTLSLVNTLIKKDFVKISISIDSNLPVINCNKQKIQQVVMNLLLNARDALNEKYGGYSEEKLIELYGEKLHKDGKLFVRLIIKDSGSGIPANIIPNIFIPFFSTKIRTVGTGLGLSICQEIVLEHDGNIYVESVENEGTTFFIDLPAIDRED
ncbi:MAG: PAS domain S-box protein [Candidatus Delongbacteria bacterium]|nr:PAS domain S-box protein [Candidatus Delongbacteria bacterium]MBN2836282.1 PAS domain S-box protein [Candidatus Delongbacteria bacterium]